MAIRRRTFITLLGGATIAMPRLTRAQQRMRRIGILMAYAEADKAAQQYVAAFHEEMAKLGWKDGQNIRFDYAWATTKADKLQQAATELIALKPDLILSSGTPGTAALLKQTRTIPVVFAVVVDPVGSGFVANLPKPGGNATGFMNLDPKTAGKWVELLKEIAPRTTRVIIPWNPMVEPYAEIYFVHFKAAAASLGMEVHTPAVHDAAELEATVAAQAREPNAGLIPMPGGFVMNNRATVTSLAARHRLPAVYFNRAFTEAGGLLSYGNDNADNWRRAASYVNRILKGEKPADLPVQFPTKFEMIINLRTAKALGLDVPLFLQQQADEVIE